MLRRLALIALALLAPESTVSLSPSPTWFWPVESPHVIMRPYLAPVTPYSRGHRGIDLAAAGGILRAPADGVVSFVGFVVDRPVLSIRHPGGLISSYEPVTTLLGQGDSVMRGDPIGTIEPGHCSLTCLHFGVRLDGDYISPLRYLGGVPPSVLLPTRRVAEVPAAWGLPGHQNRSPARKASAGTMTVRTMSVSSSTPMHTIIPIWVSVIKGSTPSTANTAASRIPALVMTPPVEDSALIMPTFVPCTTASSLARVTRKML